MAHVPQKRILLVEDEAITAIAEKNKLQKYGYDVITVPSATEAVEAALSDTPVDLILMDIDLGPGMDGTEAAAQILKKKDIPVVFLSSHTDPGIVSLTEKITSYGYVVKNSNITVLDASIKMAFKLFEANRAVREKEKLLLSIAENYPNSFISIIEDDYTIGFSSGQEFKKLGLNPDTYKGRDLKEIFGEHYDLVKEYYLRTFEGEECSFEILFKDQHQSYKTVPLYSENGRITQILAVVENITSRKQTEEQLKESEEKFRQVYEHMSVGIAQVSLDFNILSANDAYCTMLGYSEDELIGKSLKEITHPESMYENIQKQKRLSSGDLDYFRLKKSFIHKKGYVIKGMLDANLIRDSYGEPIYFLGSVLNITDSEKTEEELQNNRERFSLAMDAVREGLWDWNIATNEVYYSPAYAEMLGYTLKEIPQHAGSWSNLVHTEDREKALAVNRECIENNCSNFKVEFRMKAKDGSYRWILSQGKAIHRGPDGKALRLIGTHTDITDRKQIEEGLKHKQDLLESMFSNIQGISYRCALDKDWTMKYMSPHVEHLTGYPREDFINNTVRTFESIIHRDDTDFVDKEIHKAVDAEIPWEIEYRIIAKGSSVRYVYEKGKAVRNNDGSINHLDGLIIDISEKTAIEEKLRDSQEKLLQAQFLAGIGNFSWEIKTGDVTWSEGMYKLLKYDLNEAIDYSKVNKAIHHPDDLEEVTKWLTECITSGEENVAPKEYRLIQKDGTIIYVQANVKIACRNGKPDVIFGTCQDITPRKTAELQLQKSENLYRLLADNSADLVWTCGTNKENYPFTYINPAVEEMLGYTVEEFLKLPLQKRWTPGSLKIFENSLDEIADSGETGIFQLKYLHKNNKIINCELWVKPVYNDDGRVTGFQGRTIDVTIRKMAEELLAEQTTSLIGRVNELNCLYGLSKLIENTEAPLEEIYQGAVNLLPPAWQHPLLTCARLVFDNNEYLTDNYQETSWQLTREIFIQNKQRGIFTVGYLSEQPEADEGPFLKEEKALLKETAERLGHLTEHRNAETEIKRLLEEKKIFLKEIHHRIKNNMAMVEGLLSLQLESVNNPDALSALQSSINRITGMRILYDKLIITDDYEMLSVSQYIDDLIDSIFTTFPPGKDVTIARDISNFQLSSKVLFPLGIILNELLTNVLKYAFDTDDKGLIQVIITNENNHITLSICDNGRGLAEDFNSSNTAKGLGLLLVQMLTKQLKGTFTITGSQGTVSILEFDASQ